MIVHERRHEEVSSFKTKIINRYPYGSLGWKLVFENHNKRNTDGRINLGEDKHAQSISPYANGFENNIEDSIKPIIFLLLKKGFYPYSSCEGHGKYPVGHIILAFETEDNTRGFISSMPWYVKYFINIKYDRLNQPLSHQKIDGYKELAVNLETDMFLNTLFNKNSSNWISLQIRFRFHTSLIPNCIYKRICLLMIKIWFTSLK